MGHVEGKTWNGFQSSLKERDIYKECDPSEKWANIKKILGPGQEAETPPKVEPKAQNKWNAFQKEMGGLGLTKDGMADLYDECKQHVERKSWNGFQSSLKERDIYKECDPSEKWANIKNILGPGQEAETPPKAEPKAQNK